MHALTYSVYSFVLLGELSFGERGLNVSGHLYNFMSSPYLVQWCHTLKVVYKIWWMAWLHNDYNMMAHFYVISQADRWQGLPGVQNSPAWPVTHAHKCKYITPVLNSVTFTHIQVTAQDAHLCIQSPSQSCRSVSRGTYLKGYSDTVE